MKYSFLPNINKTKILDNIELSLPQQLYLARSFDPFNSKLSVGLIWDRGVGQSYAQAIYYIEVLLHMFFKSIKDATVIIRDHYENGTCRKANMNLVEQISKLLQKDNFIICWYGHGEFNKIKIVRQDKPKRKNKEYQYD